MAKQMNAQPRPLQSLIKTITLHSEDGVKKITQKDIAAKLMIRRDYLSRLLTEEANGTRNPPEDILRRLKFHYKQYLAPVHADVKEEDALSKLMEELIYLREYATFYGSVISKDWSAQKKKEAEESISKAALKRLEKWRGGGGL